MAKSNYGDIDKLVGKTIVEVQEAHNPDFIDQDRLQFVFSDGSRASIAAEAGGYDDEAKSQYPAFMFVTVDPPPGKLQAVTSFVCNSCGHLQTGDGFHDGDSCPRCGK
jgi:hypothetical protein